jgi:hypothetical protein
VVGQGIEARDTSGTRRLWMTLPRPSLYWLILRE